MAATLRRNAQIFGADQIALRHGDDCLSWSELEARANQRARHFQQLGVRPGDFITIALPNGNSFYECAFAAWKLGATPNPLSAKLPQAEFSAILDVLKPAVVVSEGDRSPGEAKHVDPRTRPTDYSTDPVDEVVARHWRALASGGSTGRPKIVVDADDAMWDVSGSTVGHRPGETMLNPGPLYHGAPFIFTNVALFVGCRVVGMERFDAEQTLQLIERHRINWITMVPTMMSRIWALPREVRESYDLSSLRMVWHMAAPMPVWLKEVWIDWMGADKVFEIYTGTERQAATGITGEEWLRKKGSVGRVTTGEMRILDEEGKQCPAGVTGEIFFRAANGPNSTYSYIGAEPNKKPGGWESIGDMGYMDEDGYLFLVDRRTDMILRGGANIYPAEIEAALEQYPAIATAVAVGLPDADLGRRVHAILEPHQSAELDVAAVHAFLRDRLVSYKLPESYEITREPLRNDSGKVRRSQLRDERAAWLEAGIDFQLRPDPALR